MTTRTRVAAAGALAAFTLVASACGGSGTTSGTDGSDAAKAGGTVTLRGCTPQNPLVATNTGEVCGGHVLDAVTAKLVKYNAKTAAPENDIADAITTEDNQHFTVKLKKGYTFSDGTEVKAKNFVDAWNWAALGTSAQSQATFFESIAGYDDVQCGNTDCSQKPVAQTMSGLKVVDDYTFTIATTAPVSNLPVRLGYSAFVPQPDSFLANPTDDAFGKLPIGAGPFKVTENTATQIVMEKRADYSGSDKANVDKIVYKIYNDANAAWADVVANNLDFTDVVPNDQLTGDQWRTTLGQDRTTMKESGTIEVLTVSPNDEQLKDNTKLRTALGQAIDRATITQQIFTGSRVPATGWVSPVVDGYKAGQCGAACTYDAAAAKKAYDEAGGYKGTLLLSVNGDGNHKAWADAVCNGLKNDLGVDCQTNITPDFRTLLNQAKAGELKGLFRSGWVMDYPSIENFLTPIYKKGAGSNYSNFDNPQFEATLTKAAAATTLDEANTLYQQAEAMLAETYPTIPLWYRATPAAWSNKVANVVVTPFGWIDTSAISVK